MATYLSCVVAPWTPTPWHRPGGKLKKSTSEHGNDYQSNDDSSSPAPDMGDDSSSPAPDRTMDRTIYSCGRCVIGTRQHPFICRDCVAETSGQTCSDVWCLTMLSRNQTFSNIAYMSSQLPPSPAGAAPRAPPPDPSAAGGAPRPAPTWPRVTANPPQQPLLLLPDQDQEVKGVGLVPHWQDQDHSMLTAMNMTITIMYLGKIHNMSLVPVTFGNFFFQIFQKWHFLG